jgi:hypothetical protein
MRTILAAMFAVMIGLSFVGSTFADEKKMDAPAAAPSTDMSKKSETKSETTTENKNGKKKKKHKKTTKEESTSTEKH